MFKNLTYLILFMEKGLLIFLFLAIGLLFIPMAYSSSLGEFQERVDNLGNIADDFSHDPSNFLKEELNKRVENSFLGRWMNGVEMILSPLNPLFNFIFHSNFSWTLLFLLTILLWVVFILVLYRIFSGFEIVSTYLRLVVFVIMVLLVSLINLAGLFSELAVSWISQIDSFALQIIATLFLFVLIIFILLYSSIIESIFIKVRKGLSARKLQRKVDGLKEEVVDAKTEINNLRESDKQKNLRIEKEERKKSMEKLAEGYFGDI